MGFDMLYKGKEREDYTAYSEELNEEIKKLYLEIKNHPQFKGSLQMFGDKLLAIDFNPLMKLSVVFEKQPNQSVISFERKYFDLTHVKLTNQGAIEFLKRIVNDEIYIVEHRKRFLTALFPFLYVKVWDKNKYHKVKSKYLNNQRYKIYTSSTIIQK
jgi:hypothetical protein